MGNLDDEIVLDNGSKAKHLWMKVDAGIILNNGGTTCMVSDVVWLRDLSLFDNDRLHKVLVFVSDRPTKLPVFVADRYGMKVVTRMPSRWVFC